MQLEIHKLNKATYTYSLDFVGDIDFSQGAFNMHHGNTCEVQINEAGFAKMLSAKAKDKFEIALPETIMIDRPANAQQELNWACILGYTSSDLTNLWAECLKAVECLKIII